MEVIRNYQAGISGGTGVSAETMLTDTYLAINRGAECFFEYLLTVRGGLHPSVATSDDPVRRAFMRQVLSRCWLSPELTEEENPEGCIARGGMPAAEIQKITNARFVEILKESGEKDIPGWIEDCTPTLGSEIRDDAFLIDRHALYRKRYGKYHASPEAIANEVLTWLGPDGIFAATGDVDKGSGGMIASSYTSTLWGSGKKSDTGLIAGNCLKAAETVRGLADPDAEELAKAIISAVGGAILDGEAPETAVIRCMGWGQGRASTGKMRLQKALSVTGTIPAELLESLADGFRKEGDKKKGAAAEERVPPAMTDRLREDLEKAVGTPFRFIEGEKGRDQRFEFCSFMGQAGSRFSGFHSFLKNQTLMRKSAAEEAEKVRDIPDDSVEAYSVLCDELALLHPTRTGSYLIHPRALRGWEKVCDGFRAAKDEIARKEAVGKIQAEEGDNFGHNSLFSLIAEDRFTPLWEKGDASVLKSLVTADRAAAECTRRKSPSVRHIDPVKHPIHPEYGVGKLPVEFIKPDRAGSGSVVLSVLSEGGFRKTELRWHSQRICKELFPEKAEDAKDAIPVPKADKIGRAAGGDFKGGAVNVANVSDTNAWGCKLIPVRGKPGIDKNERIRWRLMASAKLEPAGPWVDFCSEHGLDEDPWKAKNKEEGRSPQARLKLCRIPGIRIMGAWPTLTRGVFCSVWRTLSPEETERICKEHGEEVPGPGEINRFIRSQNPITKKKKFIVLKRTGPDQIGGKANPSPWAVLEKTFDIKLDGEGDNYVRKASPEELKKAAETMASSGISRKPETLPKNFLSLGWFCTLVAGRILERHRRAAVIARDLFDSAECEDPDKASFHVARALANWANGTTAMQTPDPDAKELWKEMTLKTGIVLPDEKAKESEEKRRGYRGSDFLKAVRAVGPGKFAGYAEAWKTVWETNDPAVQKTIDSFCLIAAADLPGKTFSSKFHTHGFSFSSISLFQEVIAVRTAFATRERPDREKIRIEPGFCSRMRKNLAALTNTKRKETASRIAAAAVGIGHDGKQCHCVVIPDSMPESSSPSRSFNRTSRTAAMTELLNAVETEVPLFGIRVVRDYSRSVYTKSPLTGNFMVRCTDIPADKVMKVLEKRIKSITSRLKRGGEISPADETVIRIATATAEERTNQLVTVPDQVGHNVIGEAGEKSNVFVNAATKTALAPLLDPDWIRTWDFVPCGKDNLPDPKFTKGSTAFSENPLAPVASKEEKTGKGKKKKSAGTAKNNILWQASDGSWGIFKDVIRKAEGKICEILFEKNLKTDVNQKKKRLTSRLEQCIDSMPSVVAADRREWWSQRLKRHIQPRRSTSVVLAV